MVQAVSTFRQNIVDGHDRQCRWHNNPCPASYSSFPPATNQQLVKGFMSRLQSCVTAGVPPPQVHSDSLSAIDVPTEARREYGVQSGWFQVAVCGWEMQNRPNKGAPVLYCRLCHRHVGTWNFATASSTSESSSSSNDSAGKALDPVKEHRWFCPWVCGVMTANAETNTNLTESNGCERVADAIRMVSRGESLDASSASNNNGDDVVAKTQRALDLLAATTSI